jgi:5-methylcytosine-specific restriction endonuclease McrA
MLNPKLEERIKEFLPQVRVGVDFGETAGGIAVVRGNRVLHAETYVDFHETTLEQRRQLRRGRRTRHAKKMRLARLRSWILRQRLPDGSRLPDPYRVMSDPRFHVQPGVFESPVRDPASAPSWVDLAREGKTDAAGFVKALTLIFQKRGYKWDAIELAEMTDSKLKDFLATARVPTQQLYDEIRTQIKKREDDPDCPIRGKPKVGVDELLQLLDDARKRPRQPRQAEHRDVKRADLIEVIDGFGQAAGLSIELTERWKRELSGWMNPKGEQKHGLLNKVLRPARFENRLKSGCAWCGKPTPRKSKVRHVAYAAAVCNLRVRDGRIPRRLNKTEMDVFWNWWKSREAATIGESATEKDAPKEAGIKGYLKRLGGQEKMARQFYDLLWNPNAKGRASLCQRHLEEAAKGMTMKEAGVEWQTIAVRKAPNPCREQHDARVLHRLEQILFKPGKTGDEAWRYGPVQLITLEIPPPRTEQARKGEQKERKQESFMERLAKETGGVCIYCDRANAKPAEDKDHIFPQSRGGPDVWDNLVPACRAHNTEKGDRTPWEWLGHTSRWAAFETRVEELASKGVQAPSEQTDKEKSRSPRFVRISEHKRDLLLRREPDYPDNPTPLAHVGSGPRQFVVGLGEIFSKRGVKPPRIDYQRGEPHVQRIDGRTTSQLRKSWLKKADEHTDNFPSKDRWDLLNHAQDAALIAACPPHTWRDTIFCHRAIRPKYAGDGKFTWAEQDGLAVHEVAPDWAEYMARRSWPVVRVLGRYPVGWKRSFADQNFYQNPEKLNDKRLRQHVPLVELTYKVKMPDKKQSASETKILNPDVSSRFPIIAQELINERERWDKEHPKRDKELNKERKKLGLTENRTIPKEKLDQEFRGVRHVNVSKNKGGTLARVKPADGPPRKIQLKKASEAVVIWVEKGQPLSKLQLSVQWPAIFRKFGIERFVPSIPDEATILDTWKRHKLIWLDDATGHAPGFYRVKKFDDGQVTVLPENAVTDELAKRLYLKAAKRRERKSSEPAASETGEPEMRPAAEDNTEEPTSRTKEIKLGKKKLVAYFQALNEKGGVD